MECCKTKCEFKSSFGIQMGYGTLKLEIMSQETSGNPMQGRYSDKECAVCLYHGTSERRRKLAKHLP